MATGTILQQLERLSDASTVVGVDKTREEYLKLFSRPCYSPQYERPYSSPVSGFYNAVNSSTSLILLNQRFRNSHLREQTLLEELSHASPKEFDYESIIETEPPKSKKHIPRILSSHKSIDPYRHFESITLEACSAFLFFCILIQGQTKYWHDRRCTTSSLVDNSTDVSYTESNTIRRSHTPHMKLRRSPSVNCRSQSAFDKNDKYRAESQLSSSFSESLSQYYHDVLGRTSILDRSLQQSVLKEPSNQRLKSSVSRRKLPLTNDQQLYLLEKHHIYDIKDDKTRRTNAYSQVLTDRFKTDIHCKPKFRLNNARDYMKYAKFLHLPRSITPNSFCGKPMDDRRQPFNNDFHRSFTMSNNKTFLTVPLQTQRKQIVTISV